MRQSEISLGDPAFKSETGSEQLSHKKSGFQSIENLVCDLQPFNRVPSHSSRRVDSLSVTVCSGVCIRYANRTGQESSHVTIPSVDILLYHNCLSHLKKCVALRKAFLFPPGGTKAWQM